jgi:starch phosphorylase
MSKAEVAYFSMEIAVGAAIPTYSGGLGVLAGDVIRAAADAGYPMVGVTLLYREGYFRQYLDDGRQYEGPQIWQPETVLTALEPLVSVHLSGREVRVRAWRFDARGVDGATVPVYFLDTDVEGNDDDARALTRRLYGGDARYRLEQEALLGIGGVELLRALGHADLSTYHMNEGHSALLVLALLEREGSLERARERCVFTTHTPVPAGHDRFEPDLVAGVLGQARADALRANGLFDHDGTLNMTVLALRGSRYANAVAMRHGEVSRAMFPDYEIAAITNGVHAATWAAPPLAALFDRRLPGWRRDNGALRQAVGIPLHELRAAHAEAKTAMVERIGETTGVRLDPQFFTIGIARRATAYKRVDLILSDLERLHAVARRGGGLQLVFAGKAHPRDYDGKAAIERICAAAQALGDGVRVVFVENYDMTWGGLITGGVDLWLNTPRPPLEASGTSGMKAAVNGVPSLSVLDGWWIEGAFEGVTGWSVDDVTGTHDGATADTLYRLLEETIVPLYAERRDAYLTVMRAAIALNGSYFNAQRMLAQYAHEAYRASEREPELV